MTARELIERLKDFNLDDEVTVISGFSVEYSDVRVGRYPNTIEIGACGSFLEDSVKELKDAADDLSCSLDELEGALEDDGLEGYDRYTDDMSYDIDSINYAIEDLEELIY